MIGTPCDPCIFIWSLVMIFVYQSYSTDPNIVCVADSGFRPAPPETKGAVDIAAEFRYVADLGFYVNVIICGYLGLKCATCCAE